MEVYHDIEQHTDAWLKLRAGVPTASNFSLVKAKVGPRGGTTHKEYVGRTRYMHRLAGELLTGRPEETFSSYEMDRGRENEDEARDYYAAFTDSEPVQIGFILNGNCGASPDALLAEDGLLEIKDAKPSVQIARLKNGALPSEHRAQVQGQLMVSERSWVDFLSYSRGLPELIIRVERDEDYISELREAVDQFCAELEQLVKWIKAM